MSRRYFKHNNLKHNLSLSKLKPAAILRVTELHTAVTFHFLAQTMARSMARPNETALNRTQG